VTRVSIDELIVHREHEPHDDQGIRRWTHCARLLPQHLVAMFMLFRQSRVRGRYHVQVNFVAGLILWTCTIIKSCVDYGVA